MTYGGLSGSISGVGAEAYRQEGCRGRKWSDRDVAMRAQQFSRSSISFGGEAPLAMAERPRMNESSYKTPLDAKTTFGTSYVDPARSGTAEDAGKAIGDQSHYGVPEHLVRGGQVPHLERPFASPVPKGMEAEDPSFLNNKAYAVGPEYGTFVLRQPVHLLSQEVKSRVRDSVGDEFRPPSPTGAGVPMGQLEREYKSVAQALKPPGAGEQSAVADKTKTSRFNSFHSMQVDRTKHVRNSTGPRDGFAKPATSNQVIGWSSEGAGMLPKGFAQNMYGPRMPRSTNEAGPGMLCHRETRVRQSMLVGARHVNGYGGQGTL